MKATTPSSLLSVLIRITLAKDVRKARTVLPVTPTAPIAMPDMRGRMASSRTTVLMLKPLARDAPRDIGVSLVASTVRTALQAPKAFTALVRLPSLTSLMHVPIALKDNGVLQAVPIAIIAPLVRRARIISLRINVTPLRTHAPIVLRGTTVVMLPSTAPLALLEKKELITSILWTELPSPMPALDATKAHGAHLETRIVPDVLLVKRARMVFRITRAEIARLTRAGTVPRASGALPEMPTAPLASLDMRAVTTSLHLNAITSRTLAPLVPKATGVMPALLTVPLALAVTRASTD